MDGVTASVEKDNASASVKKTKAVTAL